MWLFDDLLKKPPQPANESSGTTSGQASGEGTGQWDNSSPVLKIEKTEEQSILTDSVTPALWGSTMIVWSPESMGASWIIVNGEPVNITPVAPQSNPSPIIIETPPVVAPSSVIITEPVENTLVRPTEPLVPAETTVVTDALSTEPLAPVNAPENTNLGNLLWETNTEMLNIESSTLQDAPWALEETISDEIKEDTIAVAEEDTSISALIGNTQEDEPEEEKETEQAFVNLREYIEANIRQTDELIAKIHASHEIKLEEAAGYKSEKERFADLEQNAYTDAEKMVAEQAHAEKMKAYFVQQLAEEAWSSDMAQADAAIAAPTETKAEIQAIVNDEPLYYDAPMEEDITLIEDIGIDGSVETALTGLAVQNTVNTTMEKKHKAKTATKKKEEEFSLI
jgi:hypothetical protein